MDVKSNSNRSSTDSILITGGAGFIGLKLARRLSDSGYRVAILDNLLYQVHTGTLPNLTKGVEFFSGDVRDAEFCESVVKKFGPTVVYHLASETGTGQSMERLSLHTNTNVLGTAHILDALKAMSSPAKVILSSSRAVYGDGRYTCSEHGDYFPEPRLLKDLEEGKFDVYCPTCRKISDPLVANENDQCKPVSVYGMTKLAQEELLGYYCDVTQAPAVIVRFQNVYGPNQSLTNPYTGVLSTFSQLVLRKQALNIYEDGLMTRDFVYVDDVVDSLIKALTFDRFKPTGRKLEKFNIGSGEILNFNELVECFRKATISDVNVFVSGKFRIGDVRHVKPSLQKASELLGFTSSVSAERGISKLLEWVSQEMMTRSK